MSLTDSQNIEAATTSLQAQPDAKTRRYDRQLRLWAATGQAALESSRILLLSASATSTSILKNLVLPGIGHFTVLDPAPVAPADAGNNFFLDGPSSIGKNRAAEAVRLLGELNDGVEGAAVAEGLEEVLRARPGWVREFTLVVAHNLEGKTVQRLADLLWGEGEDGGPPLVVVRSAGFLAEFFVQFHDHAIVESHSDSAPSLRITNPFPALLEHATSLDLSKLDPTDHGHVPYVIILVRALEDWKKSHGGNPPTTYAEKQEFKKTISAMKVKPDEENFEEAENQAYRCWSESKIPSDIQTLLSLSSPPSASASPHTRQFHTLLRALRAFTAAQPPHTLPLSPALPDMHTSTESYVHLQKMYRARAQEERGVFEAFVRKEEQRERKARENPDPNTNQTANANQDENQNEDREVVPAGAEVIESFLKNCHALKLLTGRKWGAFDVDREALATALTTHPKETSTHLAFSALSLLPAGVPPTEEALRAAVRGIVGQEVELPEEWDWAAGELARAPTADIPTTAAFLGGLVAQEAIKMITKQYVPVNGYCVVDLVESWTGVVG